MAANTLTMKSPEDVLAVVPLLLGFHPAESLCIVGVEGEHPPTARVDIPDDPEERRDIARLLTDAMVANGVTQALTVTYARDAEEAAAMGEALDAAMRQAEIGLLAALWVQEGRWRTRQQGGGFAPEEGHPLDLEAHPMLAEQVFRGHPMPLESREALAERLHGTPDPEPALDAAQARMATLRAPVDVVAEARWLQGRIREWLTDSQRLDDDDVARILAAVQTVPMRDVVLAEITLGTASSMVDLLMDLTRRAHTRVAGRTATLLAFAAWQSGNGALGWVALDHAQRLSASDALTGLVEAALTNAVPPHEWPGLDPEDLPVFGSGSD